MLLQRRSELHAVLLLVAGACLCLLAQEALETRPRRLEALTERDLARRLAPTGQLSPQGERWLSVDAANETQETHKADAADVPTAADAGKEEDHVAGGHEGSGPDDQCWRNNFGLHGKGGVKEVGKVTLTTAWLLVGSLGLSMVGLYLVNYDDPQVRNYIWNLISSTISIFLAVGINHAINQFIFVQIIQSPRPRGLGICHLPEAWTKGIRFVFLSISGGIISILSCKFQKDPHRQHAASTIFSHIHGFAGIMLFGTWQQDVDPSELHQHHFDIHAPMSKVVGVLAIAFVTAGILTAIRFHVLYELLKNIWPPSAPYVPMPLAADLPEQRALQRGEASAGPAPHSAQKDDEVDAHTKEGDWKHVALEAEMEASSMYLSFCTSQLLLLSAVKHMAPMHYGTTPYPSWNITVCLKLSLALFALLMVGTAIRKKLSSILNSKVHHRAEEAAEWLQMYTTMTMIWVLLRAFIWGVKEMLPKSPDLVQVVTAGMVSMFGVLAIIGIDKVADRLGLLYEKDNEGNRVPTNSDSSVSAREIEMAAKEMEKALRSLIAGIGLLVGVSWERAFEAANFGIIDGTPMLKEHPVVSFIVLMVVLVVIVIPAWLLYIVPMAAMKWEEHELAMSLEKCREDFAWGPFREENVFLQHSKGWTDDQLVAVLVACARDKEWGQDTNEWIKRIKRELEKPYFQSDSGRKAKLLPRSKSTISQA